MSTVVLLGRTMPLGRRVAALLEADADVERVVAVDGVADATSPDGDLKVLLEGADVVLHLESHPPAAAGQATGDVERARLLLEAAGDAGVRHLVLMSDATAYGAWANNAVPLTEDAPLRPNPGFVYAAERAEIERLVAEWRDDHPGATVTLLRPAPVVARGQWSWLLRALRAGSVVPAGEDEPPAQFLLLDDLASAVDLARRERLDGPYNVAPDGWVAGDEIRALLGRPPRLRLPERPARRFAAWRWRWGFAAPPPELVPYTLHPWVLANDRLEAAGWTPSATSEEALVEAHDAGAWATLSPRRRQELALGGAAAVLAAGAAAVVAGVRRARKRAA
jgi:nucleoside-diphosphate-sugar epimerase